MDKTKRQKIIRGMIPLIFGGLILLSVLSLLLSFGFMVLFPDNENNIETKTVVIESTSISRSTSVNDKKITDKDAKLLKEIAEICNGKGKSIDAYEVLTPRMKEKVRIMALKDYYRNPEKYYVVDGTIHLK